MTPGQSRSARQQYKYDVLTQAAQDAMEALSFRKVGDQVQENKIPNIGRARSILKTALKEVGEYDRD